LHKTYTLAAQGANITAHYNSQRAPLLPLLEQYGSDRVHLTQADLVSEDDVAALFSSSSQALGPVEVAVVNHGYYPSADVPLAEMELSQWRATHDTNLTSSFLVCRAFLRGLAHLAEERKNLANIIFVGSTAGKFGEAGHADYASTKSGGYLLQDMRSSMPTGVSAMMYALTRTLKNEIVKIAPGARVNCVAPGWTRTPMAAAALADGGNVYRALATCVAPLLQSSQG
jgi:NAD(P)-dependent dehydrogenase (short-subunit alcohol dehydrogenase family)